MTRYLAPLLTALVLLGACGSSASDAPAAAPDDAVTGAPATHNGGSGSGPELREPEDGLLDVRPRPFDSHRAKGRKVTLFYYSGVEECYGLDRIEVDESPSRVTITIYEGRRPEAEICPELAVEVRSVVTLDRPLGKRKVVDGAD